MFSGGTPQYVDLDRLDLSKVTLSDFNNHGLATIRLDSKHYSNGNDALVHGSITLQRIGNTNKAQVAFNSEVNGRGGMYDFEMHRWNSPRNIFVRNPATIVGKVVNGTRTIPTPYGFVPEYTGGTAYPIYYNGTVTIGQ